MTLLKVRIGLEIILFLYLTDMQKKLLRTRLFKSYPIIALCFLLMSYSSFSKDGLSLIAKYTRYCESSSNQWVDMGETAIPISLSGNEIIFGTVPEAVFKIVGKINKPSEGDRNIACKCINSSGTEFMVNIQFFSKSDIVITAESKKIQMEYKCSISNEKPYYNMVDLGLSCKWGLTNYNNYPTDIVSATYGAGKRLTYDEANNLFGTGVRHLPTTRQINELLNRCSWEFIVNPDNSYYKGYLVTGPNGNSIFLPCNDGDNGNFSFGWYLSSEKVDAYLANALQLNVNNKIVYPYERHYYGNVRLVEDK